MADLHRNTKILQLLTDSIIEAYVSAEEDRHKLHELEWSSPIDTPSILGESEIAVDAIVGLSTHRIDRINKEETLENLQKYSIYNSKVLGEWLSNEGENYKEFSLYLHIAELMRLFLIEIIKGYDEK